jgi:hypothetical protein
LTTKSEYPKALVLRFDDWEALYIDGKLAAEGLKLGIADLVDAAWKTDIMVRDIRYHLCNRKMQIHIDCRRMHDTYCPPLLTDFGEENLKHVRV